MIRGTIICTYLVSIIALFITIIAVLINNSKKKSRKFFTCGILFCSNEPNPMVLRLVAEVPLPLFCFRPFKRPFYYTYPSVM